MKIGILSGIHEDIVRLEEALTLLNERGCDILVCLGDIVGYSTPYYGYFKSRNAHKAVQLIKSNCKYAVVGNHDIFAIKTIPQISAFNYPDNWYELSYSQRTQISNGEIWVYGDELPTLLEQEDEKYLQSLPEYIVQDFGDLKVMLSHYVCPNIVGDSTKLDASKSSMQEHFAFMNQNDCQISIFSHDLQTGFRVFHQDLTQTFPFKKHYLENFPIALNGPWVANGTETNGVMVLDTEKLSIDVIPLNTPPHQIPDWFYK